MKKYILLSLIILFSIKTQNISANQNIFAVDNIEVNNLDPGNNYFKALTRSIVYQQLSGHAAKTIFSRFKRLDKITRRKIGE